MEHNEEDKIEVSATKLDHLKHDIEKKLIKVGRELVDELLDTIITHINDE